MIACKAAVGRDKIIVLDIYKLHVWRIDLIPRVGLREYGEEDVTLNIIVGIATFVTPLGVFYRSHALFHGILRVICLDEEYCIIVIWGYLYRETSLFVGTYYDAGTLSVL